MKDPCAISLSKLPQVRVSRNATTDTMAVSAMVGGNLIVGTPEQWQTLFDAVGEQIFMQVQLEYGAIQ